VQARITRAKKTIAAAGVPFELPPAGERRERLGGVLSVLYVIFTEGSTATSGDRLLRPDVASEAIRLARTLAALQPAEPEVHGLLALCELTAARFPARTGPDGSPILLADQDRRRWDRSAIRRGLAALTRASTRGLGPYGLQAAIAAAHASAPSVEATDWDRIVVLYEALGRDVSAEIPRRGCRSGPALQAAGSWVFAGGLLPPENATVVTTVDGRTTMTDGPFAAAEEQIAGFWVIRCKDRDEALAWATQCSAGCVSPIEVRPFDALSTD
jgi:hypothetical protein